MALRALGINPNKTDLKNITKDNYILKEDLWNFTEKIYLKNHPIT